MPNMSWLKNLRNRLTSRGRRRPVRRTARLCLESLDERVVPRFGGLDLTFGTGGTALTALPDGFYVGTNNSTGSNNAFAIQPDGKVVVAGTVHFDGQHGLGVTRLNADGSLDTSFDADGTAGVYFGPHTGAPWEQYQAFGSAVALWGDKIVVVGRVDDPDPVDSGMAVAVFNADGSLDTTFGNGGRQSVYFNINPGGFNDVCDARSVAVWGDRIVLGGYYLSTNEYIPRSAVAVLKSDGSLDTAFGGGTRVFLVSPGPEGTPREDTVTRVTPWGDRLAVVGYAAWPQDYGASYHPTVTVFKSDGNLDAGFGSGGMKRVDFTQDLSSLAFSAAVWGDKLVIGGWGWVDAERQFRMAAARMNADGSPDTSFDGDGLKLVDLTGTGDASSALLVWGDQLILAGRTGNDMGVARLNGDGSVDTDFSGGGQRPIHFDILAGKFIWAHAAAVVDGKLVPAGNTDPVLPDVDIGLARLGETYGTSLSAGPSSGTYGGTATLRATLTVADGTPLAGKEVAFTIDGVLVGSDGTDADGVATIEVMGYDAGAHALGATFAADYDYDGSGATGTFTVAKADQTIQFNLPSDPAYGDAPFAARGWTGTGRPVRFSIVSGPATVAYDEAEGEWKVTLTGAGTVAIKAEVDGDANHNPASLTRTINVAPRIAAATSTGQTVWAISGPGTTAQVTLSAAVDGQPSDFASINKAVVEFWDVTPGRAPAKLATAPVTPTSGSTNKGTASATATLSGGASGLEAYRIEARVAGGYANARQLDPTHADGYRAAHPLVTVWKPGANGFRASGALTALPAAGGALSAGLTGPIHFAAGVNFTRKLTNPAGQVMVWFDRSEDGAVATYYAKSDSIISVTRKSTKKTAVVNATASIFKVVDGETTLVQAGVPLRLDLSDGRVGTTAIGDKVGITLGTADNLWLSNNWLAAKGGKATQPQDVWAALPISLSTDSKGAAFPGLGTAYFAYKTKKATSTIDLRTATGTQLQKYFTRLMGSILRSEPLKTDHFWAMAVKFHSSATLKPLNGWYTEGLGVVIS